MKIPVIITTVLIAQVSASFFDVFHGAVLSVQNSFGKLLSDVVTDVRDTVDCTILAVEHVLSLSDDASARYYDKCVSGKNKTDSGSGAQQDGNLPKVEVSLEFSNNEEYLTKEIPAEIDARINETLSKVLGSYNPQGNLLSVENVLAKESEKLADLSDLVKQELKKLSNDASSDFKIKNQKDSEPSVDRILQEIKLLENREQNTKNTSEANQIHGVIDDVLDKLGAIEATEANENIKLEEILKHLENNSNNSFIGLRQQFEEWKEEESRHLGEIKNKMEEHEKIAELPGHSYNSHKSNNTQTGQLNTIMTENDTKLPKTNGLPSFHTVQQESKDADTDPNLFTNITSTDKDNTSEPTINSQEIMNKELSTRVKEILDNITSPRTVENINKELSPTTAPTPYTLSDNALNNTVITSTSFSTTESTFVSEITHPLESTTATRKDKPSTSSTYQPTTVRNKVNEDNSNDTIMSTTFLLTENAPVNDTILPVETTTDSEEQESSSVISSEPTAILKLAHDNDSNETGLMSNLFPITENTSVGMITHPVETNIHSGIEESLALTTYIPTTISNTANNGFSNDNVITSTADEDEAELTLTTQKSLNNDTSNYTVRTNTAITVVENTPVTGTVHLIEGTIYSENRSSTLASNELATIPSILNDNDSNDAIITSTLSSIKISKPVSEIILPVETNTASGNDESSIVTMEKLNTASKIVNNNDSNDTMITRTTSPIILSTPVSETILPVETTTASAKAESTTVTSKELTTSKINNVNDSNDTVITSTSSPIIFSTFDSVSETIQPAETTMTSGYDVSSTVTINELATTAKIVNDNESSDTIITSTPSQIIDVTSVSEAIQPIEIITVSANEEFSTWTTNKPIYVTNTADGDYTNAVMVTSPSVSTPQSRPEINQPVENTTTVENEEPSTLTINSPRYNTSDTLIDNDSNENVITSTSSPTLKSIVVSEIIQPVESTTATENEEPITLTTNQPATIAEKATNDDDDLNDIVTSTDSASVNDTIQPVEITMDSGKQELSPTSTQYTLNDTVTTSTAFTPRQIISASETILPVTSTTVLRNEEYRDLSTLPPFMFTESPRKVNNNIPLVDEPIIPVNREWLTPNKFNQQNYNKNGAPRNNDDLISPQSIRDRTLKREQPLINRKSAYDSVTPPVYGKTTIPENKFNQRRYNPNPAQPNYYDTSESADPTRNRNLEPGIPLTKGAFNGISTTPVNRDLKMSAPVIESETQQEKAAFDTLDSIVAEVMDSDLPFGVEDLISKLADLPTTPVTQKTYAPRRPINPQRMNNENTPYVQTPKNVIRPPYSFDGPSANTYKPPRGLTTYRPMSTAARGVNSYKNAPSDYDSFFHKPQKNTEAHDRALRDAQQLIANSKRSDRIIGNILKNRNNYGARSIFKNRGTLNSGK